MKEKLNDTFARSVTLKQFSVLAAIVQNGTITSAANALGVTPPAVTLQLKLLEQTVGMPLFDRTNQGMRPTSAGKYLLQIQARIAATLSECGETMREMHGLSKGSVAIGVVSTAKYFAPRAIAAFVAARPGVQTELFVGNRQEIIAALKAFDVDIAIMGRPPQSIEVEQQIIGDHPHVIIASPDHRFANKRRLSLKDFSGERFLLREQGSGTRTLVERMFEEANVAPYSGTEFGSNETIKQAVMAGLGVAFISAHTIAAEVAGRRLAVLPVEGLPMVRQWHAVRARAKNLLPAAASMWNFLVLQGAGFLPDVSALLKSPRPRK